MTNRPHLRWATPADDDALGQIMYDAVRNGPSRYTEAQRAAWVSEPRKGADWTAKLARQHAIIGEQDARILGFMTLAAEGYVDFAFIRPEAQGSGLFRQLYNKIEARARSEGETRLWTHASLMAHSAFAAMGFTILTPETVQTGGQSLDRFKMEKRL